MLNSDLPPVFTLPDCSHVNVIKEHVFEYLFASVSEETGGFIKDAQQACCTSILTVLKRFVDFVEGRKYHEVSEQAQGTN